MKNVPEKTALFNPLNGHIEQLFGYIDIGDLGLPDIQRPFVWPNKKVRKLFDSLYKGYPIGSYLLWRNTNANKTRQIGTENKQHKDPSLLIIDGQQRLTALYSVFRGKSVKDETYSDRNIIIAFNPITEEFKVADASTERNSEFINNISELFTKASVVTFINNYFISLNAHKSSLKECCDEIVKKIEDNEKLNKADLDLILEKVKSGSTATGLDGIIIEKLCAEENGEEEGAEEEKDVTDEAWSEAELARMKEVLKEDDVFDKEIISSRLEKLYNLKNYPFNALEIVPDLSEEQVADIFTRINSQGTMLKQADFILTLLSVFWEEGRKQIDGFCKDCVTTPDKDVKESPFNYVFRATPKDIIRITVGLGFNRGKMRDAYSILAGRDLMTQTISPDLRNKQLEIFRKAQGTALDNTTWHGFIKILIGLGFKSSDLISSSHNVVNSYILYLIGKTKFKLDHKELEKIIGRWFFFASVTSRYSSSPESQMESDLNSLDDVKSKESFISKIDELIANELTTDFWEITLPNKVLVSSSRNNPARNTYFACLVRNGTNVLFSNRKIGDLFDPSMKKRKKDLEKHHLFPKGFLKDAFELNPRQINQVANFTYLEFEDNIDISDEDPKKYVSTIKEQYFSEKEAVWNKMMQEHCLPEKFYEMKYEDFLVARRKLMAKAIRETFAKL